ncbi:hypothetical protein J6590_101539 [Homalodisca vitripennis]|nr:hypothetical protein J6590_101539 [Homalodisca vitripennis]
MTGLHTGTTRQVALLPDRGGREDKQTRTFNFKLNFAKKPKKKHNKTKIVDSLTLLMNRHYPTRSDGQTTMYKNLHETMFSQRFSIHYSVWSTARGSKPVRGYACLRPRCKP